MAQKWFTCTPRNFPGNVTFFARDSGLLCKGFQEIGIHCKAILLSPEKEDDQKNNLIRTSYKNLEDPDWWRALGADGVVFYGWGSGKHMKIAKAIRQSGCVLVTHMDTAGMLGVLNGPFEFASALWRVSMGESDGLFQGLLRFIFRLFYGCTIALLRRDITRAIHLKQAHLIGAITPIAFERIRKVCRFYGGESLANRVRLIPHPNASYMRYDTNIPKERLVIAVGRWDDEKVKGTKLLMEVAQEATQADKDLKIEIYGKTNQMIDEWHTGLSNDLKSRILIKGIVPNTQITEGLQRARISICTSLREGYHTVSAEAHCCGCSVIGPDVPEIPSMKWFAKEPFGRMAKRDAKSMAKAIIEELDSWDKQRRDPVEISKYWTETLHAPNIARKILECVEDMKCSSQ